MRKMLRFVPFALLLSGTVLAQENPRGEFYIKDNVKGFISLHGELRGLTEQAIDDINKVAFKGRWGYDYLNSDGDTAWSSDPRVRRYAQFGDRVLGLGLEIGAQYGQLLTWFDFYFNPTQESEVPDIADQTGLQSVKWFQYGFDWMWGYMLAPEQAKVNLIPSLGFGFSLLNMQFASQYDLHWSNPQDKQMESYSLGRRYYSTFGKDVTTQVELRLNLGGGLSLGGFGGIRMTWYDRFYVENGEMDYFFSYDELIGHTWFIGGKVTYTMKSRSEIKEKEKL